MHSRDDDVQLSQDLRFERRFLALEDRLNRLTIFLSGLVVAVLSCLVGVVLVMIDGRQSWTATSMFLGAIAVVWWSYAIAGGWPFGTLRSNR